MTTGRLDQLWMRSLRIYSLCSRLSDSCAAQTMLVVMVVCVHLRKSSTVVYAFFFKLFTALNPSVCSFDFLPFSLFKYCWKQIQGLQYIIQHESIELKEEKKILKEIRTLESTRAQVIANAAMIAKIEKVAPKEALQDQVKVRGF